MSKINSKRDRIQKQALKAIEANGGKGLLFMATGVGKTRIPILFAKKKKNKVKKICLIVPTERLRDEDWYREFYKWDAGELWDNVTRICYISADKIINQEFDLVILDECHNITEKSCKFFKQNKVKNIIGLTATKPKSFEKNWLLSNIGLEEVFSLSVGEAVNEGFVSPFKITVIYTQLDETTKNVEAGNKTKRFYTTEKESYRWVNNKINMSEFLGNKNNKNLLLKRMKLIYNLKSKEQVARKIINSLDGNDRTLVFCGSINQANNLSEHRFHSKSGKSSLTKFSNKEINLLSCVNSLNEGANLPDVDKAIIVQLNSNEKDLIQRIGRVVRYREGHLAHIYIICAKDTQDEVWLQKSLANIDKSLISFIYE